MSYIIRSSTPKAADVSFWGNVRDAVLCKDKEHICSGARDTGKTYGMLHKLHIIASKYPGASIVIARAKMADTTSTVARDFEKFIVGHGAPVVPYGGKTPRWFDYSNKSRIWLAGIDNPGKVLSAQHDIVYVNQVEEISLPIWEYLVSTATGRAGNVPYAFVCGDCNPRSPNHWIKRRSEPRVDSITGKLLPPLLTLFNATHRDNPEIYDPYTGLITPMGKIRTESLERLTGTRYLRLFRGLWVQSEAAIYSMFVAEKLNPDDPVHIIKHFDPPALWPRIVAIDPKGAYIGALWIAIDPKTGIFHVYREYYEPFGLSTPVHAAKIINASRLTGGQRETIYAWVGGGPSERQERLDFSAAGIPLLPPGESMNPDEPALVQVWPGIERVMRLMVDFKLLIHDNCTLVQSEIGEYERVRGRDGTMTERIKNKERFHLLDCLRYGIVWWTAPVTETQVISRAVPIGPRL